jgi:dTDP-4-dehydrorhamnose reductase
MCTAVGKVKRQGCPRQQQQHICMCRALNIPQTLLLALQEQKARKGVEALLVHISTDQVYDGSRSFWKEDSVTEPVNEYGRSKLLAEEAICNLWPKHYILRSSIIYGPFPPVPVTRTLFVQFVV